MREMVTLSRVYDDMAHWRWRVTMANGIQALIITGERVTRHTPIAITPVVINVEDIITIRCPPSPTSGISATIR